MTEPEKITEAEPRYINGSTRPIYVERPDGSDRIVRPFRELGVIAGRREEDCVVVGEHYGRFSGLLEPFPGTDAPIEVPSDTKDPMDPNDRGVAARAMASGQFKAEGEVVGPDGKVKYDNPEDDPESSFYVKPAEEPIDITGPTGATDPVATTEGDESEDSVDDAALRNVDGIGPKLMQNLQAAGISSAAALADQQEEKQLVALVEVPGVRNVAHAGELVANAQSLLGWEDVEEDED